MGSSARNELGEGSGERLLPSEQSFGERSGNSGTRSRSLSDSVANLDGQFGISCGRTYRATGPASTSSFGRKALAMKRLSEGALRGEELAERHDGGTLPPAFGYDEVVVFRPERTETEPGLQRHSLDRHAPIGPLLGNRGRHRVM